MSKTIGRPAFLAAAMTALTASAALAADPHGSVPVVGMPQLALGHPTQGPLLISSIVWMLIIFGLMYYLVKNVGLPKVAEVLAERQSRIQGDLEAAQRMKEDADAAMTAHREATAKARAEAMASVASAVASAEVENAKRSEALNARLAGQIAEAEERIARARAAAMGALRDVASETTAAVVHKLVGSADPKAVVSAVDRELAARGRA